ncbi:TetR/AcrR family transcriptional regulator [Leuconostoc citreum]|uniref:TetR/AcrR family transcriptional regulator n=1 Tax=Leuconostoc citreum TaxID=33964 RepID=UPI0032DF1C29
MKSGLLNLSARKQEKIKQALLSEFSNVSLLEAKVANIVTLAEISRGSFYTYFEDIYDAYQWLAIIVFKNVHQSLEQTQDSLSAAENFILESKDSPYYNFLCQYYTVNDAVMNSQKKTSSGYFDDLSQLKDDNEISDWLIAQAIHRLIRSYFMYPERSADIIQSFQALKAWQKRS